MQNPSKKELIRERAQRDSAEKTSKFRLDELVNK